MLRDAVMPSGGTVINVVLFEVKMLYNDTLWPSYGAG